MIRIVLIVSLLCIPLGVSARDKIECNVVTKVCVKSAYSAEEEAAADADAAAAAQAALRLTPRQKIEKFLAEKFGMTAEEVRAAIEAQE